MVEPLRHRQTKEAATDMFEPKATASHLDSTAALAVALTLGTSASAARKTLSWDDDACTHRISFDPAKHDEKRLNNSIRLLFARHDLAAPIVPFVADRLPPNSICTNMTGNAAMC
jgi:hypothetical protein